MCSRGFLEPDTQLIGKNEEFGSFGPSSLLEQHDVIIREKNAKPPKISDQSELWEDAVTNNQLS